MAKGYPGQRTRDARRLVIEDEIIEAEAVRQAVGERFDLLDPDFIQAMAHIMHVGASKYPVDQWKKGLAGNKSGLNHAFKHLNEYTRGVPNEYGPVSTHLAQVAVNAMFEFFFARQRERSVVHCSGECHPSDITQETGK